MDLVGMGIAERARNARYVVIRKQDGTPWPPQTMSMLTQQLMTIASGLKDTIIITMVNKEITEDQIRTILPSDDFSFEIVIGRHNLPFSPGDL